jgi:DNA primase
LISDETVSQIRERADIVEVVGEHVQLRRSGANYKGLCPFHQEKTPSFNVNANRQMFHCFGCGEGGDVFTFLMRFEGRTFTDAVRELGRRVGVAVEEKTPSPGARESRRRRQAERERHLSVMEKVAAFYREELQRSSGAPVRDYLERRGVSREVVEQFGIGYAPSGWDNLTRELRTLGVSPAEAERLGLIVGRRGGGGFYDRLRERVIFPVCDATGRVVAFGARVLPGAPDDVPKYINTPESPVFSKGKILYGLHAAREAMRKGEPPIVVEGYLDVISLHAHGVTSAVAPMGTALTADQASLLRRFAGRESSAVLLFDGDEAGELAVQRAHSGLAEAGVGARVVILPAGEDPDSFVRGHGVPSLKRLLEGASGLMEYLIDRAAERSASDGRSKAQAIRSLWPVLSSARDPMERDLYKRRVAEAFNVSEELVFRYLRGGYEPSDSSQPIKEARRSPRARAEAALAGALLDAPRVSSSVVTESDLELIRDEGVKWVLERLYSAREDFETASLVGEAPDARLAGRIRARLVKPRFEDEDAAKRAAIDSVTRLRALAERDEARRLQAEVNQAVLEGDADRASRLAQEKLQRKRSAEKDFGGDAGSF